ncbi:MAG: dihydropteroate synthase [Alphaproteobacteria bacterium]|nr:dihydropteroate synthase [Alphaproteobacteria bacterium]
MKRPALMGIVNVTPDSFSGDGVREAEAAIRQAQAMVQQGADIIDLGAESTRPDAIPLTAAQEWVRLAPVLEGIMVADWRTQTRLSIDTRHPETAARTLTLGVEIINDVGGLTDETMCELLGEHDCDVVVMHALGIPADRARTLPEGCDVVQVLLQWKDAVTQRARTRGIAPERLIYDVGIGFGKTAAQSLALIQSAALLRKSGGRWLYGHSRKSFLGLFTHGDAAERDDLTLAFSAQLAQAEVDYLRVHAVARHARLFGQLCT